MGVISDVIGTLAILDKVNLCTILSRVHKSPTSGRDNIISYQTRSIVRRL
jgi:hypothetical protein